MEKYYSLRIPEPCHEDWNQMTPSDKGRFCSSCEKTVIDFTIMSDYEIKDFLRMNQGQKLCGHVKKSQLDLIHIKVPVQILNTYRLGHRSFLLALLIVMGTSLMSCKDDYGNKIKIDQVEVVDSLGTAEDLIEGEMLMGVVPPPPRIEKNDSLLKSGNHEEVVSIDAVTGGFKVPPPPPPTVGEVITVQGGIGWNTPETEEVPFAIVQEVPQFLDTPAFFSESERKEYFQNQLRKHFNDNFNKKVYPVVKGRQKIFTLFTINKEGSIEDIKIKASHPLFKDEVKRVFSLLPKLKPGKQNGEIASVVFALPIIFEVE